MVKYAEQEESEEDISGEDSNGDEVYMPGVEDVEEEDDSSEEEGHRKDLIQEKVKRVKSISKEGCKAEQETDEEFSSDEEDHTRKERKSTRRTRMQEELELGNTLKKNWDFKPDDDEIMRRFCKEIWDQSSRSAEMDGSETGFIKEVLNKLNIGLKLTNIEAQFGPGVSTILKYTSDLKKIMNCYNLQNLEKKFLNREN